MVTNLPAMWETWVQSLGWDDPLEEGMTTHSSILAWRIPMDRGAWRAMVHRVAKSRTRRSDSLASQPSRTEGWSSGPCARPPALGELPVALPVALLH